MTVEFDKSFGKAVTLLKRIQKSIENIESATSLDSILKCKKLIGHKTFYRVRIGDYRLGFESIRPGTVRLITFAHRKDIYKVFP